MLPTIKRPKYVFKHWEIRINRIQFMNIYLCQRRARFLPKQRFHVISESAASKVKMSFEDFKRGRQICMSGSSDRWFSY